MTEVYEIAVGSTASQLEMPASRCDLPLQVECGDMGSTDLNKRRKALTTGLLESFQEWYGLQATYWANYDHYCYVDVVDFPRSKRFLELFYELKDTPPASLLDVTVKAAFAEAAEDTNIGEELAKDACRSALGYLRDAYLLPEPTVFTSSEIAELERKQLLAETAKRKSA